LFQVARDYNTAVVMATHDFMVIKKYPARMVKTEGGKVWDNATVEHA
jgi:cell division transport system ATP-binding protein